MRNQLNPEGTIALNKAQELNLREHFYEKMTNFKMEELKIPQWKSEVERHSAWAKRALESEKASTDLSNQILV